MYQYFVCFNFLPRERRDKLCESLLNHLGIDLSAPSFLYRIVVSISGIELKINNYSLLSSPRSLLVNLNSRDR